MQSGFFIHISHCLFEEQMKNLRKNIKSFGFRFTSPTRN